MINEVSTTVMNIQAPKRGHCFFFPLRELLFLTATTQEIIAGHGNFNPSSGWRGPQTRTAHLLIAQESG